jgi:UDP-glucose 4-epimerase
MRVLVTGATTPLGEAIVGHLLEVRDVELVMAVGRESNGKQRAHHKLTYRAVDLTRTRALHDLLWRDARGLGITAVIHGIHHRSARDVGRRVHAQNVDATRELVIACAEHPTIRRFVYRSFAEVYAPHRATPDLIDENAPLDFAPAAPQWVRDRVEADLGVCSHFGGRLQIAVLRCAEILAPDVGSQLWDYLSSRVCVHPLGFDPMLNVLSLEDAADAFGAALESTETGVFNIAGFDTLPLSRAIAESMKLKIGVPGPMVAPLYALRRAVAGFEFRYDLNERRFHFGGVLDGGRARTALGYTPHVPVGWPRPWWRRLLDEMARIRLETEEP